jgi:hypothetical protein
VIAALYVLGVVAVASFQVTVAPLFPMGGATAEFGIAAIIAVAFLQGPRAAMLFAPALAFAVGFAGSRSPGLLLIGYAGVLPIAYFIEQSQWPLGGYLRTVCAFVLAGAWLRLVLSLGAFADGAAFAPFALVLDVLTPGFAFDAIAATLLYVPFRIAGLPTLRFSLQKGGWLP